MMNAPQVSGVRKEEFLTELNEIAQWWITHCQDHVNGGFVGEIGVDNRVNPTANKGIIQNSRILWFFSEASLFAGDANYAAMADRAYDYLVRHFVDPLHGGVYWQLNARGDVASDRKQTYAQAFFLYGLSAYFKLTKKEEVLNLANSIYRLMESRTHDHERGGYLEAFGRDWSTIDDVRLSHLDLNSPKSMNTHLHVLEAYTALQVVAPSDDVASSIRRCVEYFNTHIIDKSSFHLRMFHALDWQDESVAVSYGHDIECSWLMWETLEVLQDEELKAYYRDIVVNLARTCLEQGVGEHHEVLDAYDFKAKVFHEERIWWVQAEAMVGFLNAYQMTGELKFYQAFINSWEFIKKYQKDHQHGEWHWLSTLDLPRQGDCKVGLWKAPYHNGRAMMEVCRRLDELSGKGHF